MSETLQVLPLFGGESHERIRNSPLYFACFARATNFSGSSKPVRRRSRSSLPCESRKTTVGTPTIAYCFVSAFVFGSSGSVRSALTRRKRFSSAATFLSLNVFASSSLHGMHQSA